MRNSCIFLLLCFMSSFSSFSQDIKQDNSAIFGIWSVDMAGQGSAIDDVRGFSFDSLGQKRKEALIQTMRSKIYLFSEDGTLRIFWTSHGKEMSVEGKFELTDRQRIQLQVDGRREGYRFILNPQKLILIPEEKTRGMIDRVYLKRMGS